MRLTASTDIDRVKPEDLPKYVTLFLEQVSQAVNNNLTISENFSGKVLSVVFGSANTDVVVTHDLGRVPSGYIQTGQTAAMIVYDGSGQNSSSVIYLKSSAAGTARIWVF